ncbi:tail protein [Bordetella phage vB_BbrM_PHB04]|uniref:Tail protein n=1 Tax=Bordetella phage vB_BbrM_PHB04 TaxID=2029657 RepID=A0A291LA16_9CAUD|nr:tail fiber protein [Bordetella phage vB_BbrM_PHB04]ATI15742.1 tail protein [Bordetella phage vB_BbrM_PHB04]
MQGTVNGVTSKDVSGNVNVTLSAVEAGAGILVFTGALTGNISVIVPAVAKSWIVSNRTSGAFSLTVKTAAGTGIAVAQGRNVELWCDATNVLQSTNDYTNAALLGTPTAPTPTAGDSSQQVANTEFVQQTANDLAIEYAIIFGG